MVSETIPHEVVAKTIKEGMTPIRAWREHLQLTQGDVAELLEVLKRNSGHRLATFLFKPSHCNECTEMH